jgi:hypothetical protein
MNAVGMMRHLGVAILFAVDAMGVTRIVMRSLCGLTENGENDAHGEEGS